MHLVPKDLSRAIGAAVVAQEIWRDITPLARNEWICWVTSAKKPQTRARRIEVAIDKIKKGMRRPCCWAGCPHR